MTDTIHPFKMEITVSRSEISVELYGAISVIPLDENGYYEKSDMHVADSHPDELIDLAIGSYELNQNHMES